MGELQGTSQLFQYLGQKIEKINISILKNQFS